MKAKPHTITEDILKEFKKSIAALLALHEIKIDQYFLNLVGNNFEHYLVQALSRKDEEWKEKVRGLKMEKKTEDIKGILGTDHRDGVINEGYNQAVDEFNKRVDDLLK